MQLKSLYALMGAAVVLSAASAAQANVTFVGYQTALNADETLVTSFEGSSFDTLVYDMSGFGLTGTGFLFTGSASSLSAAPGTSATTQDTTQYLSIRRFQAATLTTPALSKISFYVGSLDSFNSFTFWLANGTKETVTGAALAALPGMDANGSWTGFTTNGRLTFSFDSDIIGLTFASNGNSLEISDVGAVLAATGVVPEPATWGMMILGFGGVGGMMRRRREFVLA